MAKVISSGNVGSALTKTVTSPPATKIVTRDVQVFRDVVSAAPELTVRTRADGSKELLLQLVQAGLEVLSHSGVTPTLSARAWARATLDHCDGTVTAATLPAVLPTEDGFVCLLTTGTQQVSVTPFAGNYLDEDIAARVYPPLSLVLFVSMFGDSWTSYIISSPTLMSNAGATLSHGTNRRTTGAAFAMPALVGSPWDVRAVVFVNLTGVDVTLTAAGADRFETNVSSPTFVVAAARRSVTFLDDGLIWEPTAPAP